MTAYAKVHKQTRQLDAVIGRVDADGVGPHEAPPVDTEFDFIMVKTMDFLSAPPFSPTCRMFWHEGEAAPEWVETETLTAIKERKRAQITAARLAADADHFVYQGVKIRTADKDMFDLLVADARISKGAGMPPNWPGGWLGMNGIVYISSKAEWDPFFIAMYDTGMANFMRSQQIKAQIDNAATPAAIEEITW